MQLIEIPREPHTSPCRPPQPQWLLHAHLFPLTSVIIAHFSPFPAHTHTSISPHIRPPQAGYRNQTQPLCAGCWPGFLRAVPQRQGGGPGWRWVCTPSWLTHLSHREWLAWGDPEFSVGTGASPRAPWSHPARPWREGTGPGWRVGEAGVCPVGD